MIFDRHDITKKTWAASLSIAAIGGLLIGWYGWLGVAATLAVTLAAIVLIWPETAFVANLLTMIVGQLVRLPILSDDSGVILNDILLPPLIVAWVWRQFGHRRWPIPRSSLLWPMLVVIFFMGLSLLTNWQTYSAKELLAGSLYGLRWLEYAAVLVMGCWFVRTPSRAEKYLQLLVWIGVIVSVLGFIQLRVFPDFSFMVPAGWDPHIGRLLSTWFDPNFLAGFLSLIVTVSLAVALSKPILKARLWWLAIIIMTVAVILTFSRSGYVALAAGAGLVTIFKSRTVFLIGLIALLSVIIFVPRVNERVLGIRTIDETAKLRLVSWGNAWQVIEQHQFTGVGYNLYRYVQTESGFVRDIQQHSASGSDSSLLTIWVTTGLPGLIAYLWLLVALWREAWRTWRDKNLPPVWQGYGLGLFAGLIGLVLHAQFVNSLLYPHIMQTLWLLVAMAVMIRQPSPTAS